MTFHHWFGDNRLYQISIIELIWLSMSLPRNVQWSLYLIVQPQSLLFNERNVSAPTNFSCLNRSWAGVSFSSSYCRRADESRLKSPQNSSHKHFFWVVVTVPNKSKISHHVEDTPVTVRFFPPPLVEPLPASSSSVDYCSLTVQNRRSEGGMNTQSFRSPLSLSPPFLFNPFFPNPPPLRRCGLFNGHSVG